MSGKQWFGVAAVGLIATAGLAALGTHWVNERPAVFADVVPTMATPNPPLSTTAVTTPAAAPPGTPVTAAATTTKASTTRPKTTIPSGALVEYRVDGARGTAITWNDPATGASYVVSTSQWRWAKSLRGNGSHLRLQVNNQRGSTTATCRIARDGKVLSYQLIRPGRTGSCTA